MNSLERRRSDGGHALRIALVDNMPAAARRSSTRRFGRILGDAANDAGVVLIRFRLEGAWDPEPDLPLATPASLAAADLDGLVVTGAEPRTKDLREERYWPALAVLSEWAASRRVASYWSCLAAHAAVLHLDGVARTPLRSKCSGVYEVEVAGAHTTSSVRTWVPHSRANGLDESRLASRGYVTLSRAEAIGVNAFIRPGPGYFLLHQGHPEYDGETLGLEWRRDLRRWLAGERESAPEPPVDYFLPDTAARLAELWRPADRDAASACLDVLRRAPAPAAHWRADSLRLFSGWLQTTDLDQTRRTVSAA